MSTDELYATAQALGRLATSAAELQARVRVVDRGISMDWLAAARAPRAAAQAELEIDQAVMVLIEIEVLRRFQEFRATHGLTDGGKAGDAKA